MDIMAAKEIEETMEEPSGDMDVVDMAIGTSRMEVEFLNRE